MENNIAFLCMDSARLFRKRFAEAARALSCTGPQWRVLLTIERRPGINQGALAESLDMEPITVCRMVDRLEQAELAERRRDPSDRRAWQLFLTDQARPVVDDLHEVGQGVIDRAISVLTPDEQAVLTKLLLAVRENLASMEDETKVEEASNG